MRAAIVTAAAVCALFFGLSLIYVLTRWTILVISSDVKGEDTRNYVLTIAAAFGVPFLVWRSWIAHRQATAAREQVGISSATLSATTYAKAVELLGAYRQITELDHEGKPQSTYLPNIEGRIGALYSLEALALGDRMDVQVIYDTVAAYVRSNMTPQRASPRLDIQVAIDIVGRRPDLSAERKTYTSVIDFSGCDFTNYDLSNKNLTACQFRNCTMPDRVSNTSFSYCLFIETKISGSSFYRCSFDGTHFAGPGIEACLFSQSSLKETRFVATPDAAPRLQECALHGSDISNLFPNLINWVSFSEPKTKSDVLECFYHSEIENAALVIESCTFDEATNISEQLALIFTLMGEGMSQSLRDKRKTEVDDLLKRFDLGGSNP